MKWGEAVRAKGKNRKSRAIYIEKLRKDPEKAAAIEEERKRAKKRKMLSSCGGCLFRFSLAVVLKVAARVTAVFIMAYFVGIFGCTDNGGTKGLDYINSYNVNIAPLSDGTLEITYDIEWLVLDGETEGPVDWVKLGLGNTYCEVLECSGAARSYKKSGTYLNVYLDREYGTGETFDFSVKVHQRRMLCRNEDAALMPFYEFTPGWFNSIEVGSYRFSWARSEGIISHDSDIQTETELIWSGSLDCGERRTMTLYYDISYFNSPELVKYKPTYNESCNETHIAWWIAAGAVVLLVWVVGTYHDGRGFGSKNSRNSARRGGYRGGRGCACAGCACACACAGGGRAGCSVKDYYDDCSEITIDDGGSIC